VILVLCRRHPEDPETAAYRSYHFVSKQRECDSVDRRAMDAVVTRLDDSKGPNNPTWCGILRAWNRTIEYKENDHDLDFEW
jgi:hypothetical protein